MIKIENVETIGWEHAIRGMRNPLNSWDRSDSKWDRASSFSPYTYRVGESDLKLMTKLARAGAVHAKYRRMIVVYVDITAPLYWWKEFDTYKVGTVANSCSTMHKIHDKEFKLEDFSNEFLSEGTWNVLYDVVCELNYQREQYLQTKDNKYWLNMIQLLPSSYNQKRTVMLNYEVLAGMYESRKNHKLNEWRQLCEWIEQLPFSELIIGGNENVSK